jgi:hypothetical protein
VKTLELRVSKVSCADELIDEARNLGLSGATRLSDAILFGRTDDPSGDLSDSMILKLDAARADGYSRWLAANADRLSHQVAESGCEDSGAWLREQYTLETGEQP